MSTLIDEDRVILESLDFEPPCEHTWHERRGATGPAEWVVMFAPILECGCPAPALVLWCATCKDAVLARDYVSCNSCRVPVDPTQAVLRIESLR